MEPYPYAALAAALRTFMPADVRTKLVMRLDIREAQEALHKLRIGGGYRLRKGRLV